MKNVGFGVSLALIILVVVIGIVTIGHKEIRESESNDALKTTVDAVLDNMTLSEKYTINNNEEFVADFTQSLLQEIKTGKEKSEDENLAITVDVMNVDLEKGLLSLRIKETFTYPNKKIGTITYNTTVVLEQNTTPEEKTIIFMANGRVYKQFGVLQGEKMPDPGVPQHETNDVKDWKKDFSGWAITEKGDPKYTEEEIKNLTVENSITYYATWGTHKHKAQFVGTKEVHTRCKECGEIMSTKHTFTSTVTKEPTCTATGVRTYTCECGYAYTEVIAATGHKGDTKTGSITRHANCTQTGQRYKRCTVCGANYGTPYDFQGALGHTGNSGGSVTQAPTCTQPGYRYKKCIRCGANYGSPYQYSGALGHKSNWAAGQLYNQYYHVHGYCARCGCEMKSDTVPGNEAHSMRDVRVNHYFGGYMYVYTCSGCAYSDFGTHSGWDKYGKWEICNCNQRYYNHRCINKYIDINSWRWCYEWDAWCSRCGATGQVRSGLPFVE